MMETGKWLTQNLTFFFEDAMLNILQKHKLISENW